MSGDGWLAAGSVCRCEAVPDEPFSRFVCTAARNAEQTAPLLHSPALGKRVVGTQTGTGMGIDQWRRTGGYYEYTPPTATWRSKMRGCQQPSSEGWPPSPGLPSLSGHWTAEPRGQAGSGPYESADGLPYTGGKLGASVRDDVLRQTKNSEHREKNKLSSLKCRWQLR